MPLEQVAEFQILAEHVKTLVAAEPPELGGMRARLHAGAEGAAFEAVAAELAGRETRGDGAGLDDARDGARRQRLGADRGAGEGGRPARPGAAPRCAGTPARR